MTANPNAYYAGGLGVELYDLFTGGGLLAGDVEFYVESAQRFGGPILELGIGTARVLIPLRAQAMRLWHWTFPVLCSVKPLPSSASARTWPIAFGSLKQT